MRRKKILGFIPLYSTGIAWRDCIYLTSNFLDPQETHKNDMKKPLWERWPPNSQLPRHRHANCYIAVVLNGQYTEIGDRGRLRLTAGSVVFHGPYESHRNHFGQRGAEILNLHVEGCVGWATATARIPDPDLIVRVAEKDPREAVSCLMEMSAPESPLSTHWVDKVADDLLLDPTIRLDQWAKENGFAAESVSRVFGQSFGISPRRFRAEIRVQHALRAIVTTDRSLASIASDFGFSDQAHMTHAFRTMTGRTPKAWRLHAMAN
jgi:AraC-like DNA-binding protein